MSLREAKLPDGTEITYAIDAQDRRIGRKENGNWTHKWIYQDGLNPIAELDANDQIRKAFIYADKGHVPAYMITYKEDGSEDKQYRIISDLLGSVRLVYDLTTETEVQRIDYDVWGNITNNTHPDLQPFGFAGGLYDQQTKLTRFGARDYDAETGRWTAKDPIGFEGGDYNLYGYVANDPVNFTDSQGLSEDCPDECEVYRCSAKLGEPDTPPDKAGLTHAYSCVKINGVMICRGLISDPGEWGAGSLFDETYHPSMCKKVSSDCCVAKCLLRRWALDAGNWYIQGSCHGYDNAAHYVCNVSCNPGSYIE